MNYYILDGDLQPVPVSDVLEWGRWFETNPDARRVGLTEVNDEVSVSTVFLAIDHNFRDGVPLLFETMVFGGEYDQHMWRWHSRVGAVAGHGAVVDALREGRNPNEVAQ